jgi:hypothetical protein
MSEPGRTEVERTGFADVDPTTDVDSLTTVDLTDDPTDADFAAEHSDTTFADETADGPEHAREPDQPKGRDGLG